MPFLSKMEVFRIVCSRANPLIRTNTQIFASIHPEWILHFRLLTLG